MFNYVCAHICAHALVPMWKSEKNLQESIHSFYNVDLIEGSGPRDQI